ncbi:Uncharacterised protein [Streptococcus sobrinus]|nr:Uncharacterised protein [Streptococcus sobrinus]
MKEIVKIGLLGILLISLGINFYLISAKKLQKSLKIRNKKYGNI